MRFKEVRKKLIDEATRLRDEQIPAPILMLRRKGIRIFPDGRHVALYTNDKYNLVFTVPYGSSVVDRGQADTPLMGTSNG